MIEVKNLFFEYPGKRALDDVSFSIAEGAITALVGPNGSGKTTLLRCMASLTNPLTGKITINGYDTVDQPHQVHLSVGYLKDLFGLYNDLTVQQSLRFMAYSRIHDGRDPEQAAMEAAKKTGADRFLNAQISALSRGMRQRVGIAQAIIHQPKVLFLDEPASGLDPEGRYELSGMLTELRDTGMTLVVSSHILAELEDYSSEMLILRDGQVIEHRPLANRGVKKNIRLLEVRLTALKPEYLTSVAAMDGIRSAVESEGAMIIEVDLEICSRHDLLRRLITEGLPVEQFSDRKVDLQQEYIRTVTRKS